MKSLSGKRSGGAFPRGRWPGGQWLSHAFIIEAPVPDVVAADSPKDTLALEPRV